MAVARTELGLASREAIMDFVRQLVEIYHPEQVILFGSYAKGDARPKSDIDLLVILPFSRSTLGQAADMLERLDSDLYVQLVARTPEMIAESVENGSSFLRHVLETGEVLYAAKDC